MEGQGGFSLVEFLRGIIIPPSQAAALQSGRAWKTSSDEIDVEAQVKAFSEAAESIRPQEQPIDHPAGVDQQPVSVQHQQHHQNIKNRSLELQDVSAGPAQQEVDVANNAVANIAAALAGDTPSKSGRPEHRSPLLLQTSPLRSTPRSPKQVQPLQSDQPAPAALATIEEQQTLPVATMKLAADTNGTAPMSIDVPDSSAGMPCATPEPQVSQLPMVQLIPFGGTPPAMKTQSVAELKPSDDGGDQHVEAHPEKVAATKENRQVSTPLFSPGSKARGLAWFSNSLGKLLRRSSQAGEPGPAVAQTRNEPDEGGAQPNDEVENPADNNPEPEEEEHSVGSGGRGSEKDEEGGDDGQVAGVSSCSRQGSEVIIPATQAIAFADLEEEEIVVDEVEEGEEEFAAAMMPEEGIPTTQAQFLLATQAVGDCPPTSLRDASLGPAEATAAPFGREESQVQDIISEREVAEKRLGASQEGEYFLHPASSTAAVAAQEFRGGAPVPRVGMGSQFFTQDPNMLSTQVDVPLGVAEGVEEEPVAPPRVGTRRTAAAVGLVQTEGMTYEMRKRAKPTAIARIQPAQEFNKKPVAPVDYFALDLRDLRRQQCTPHVPADQEELMRCSAVEPVALPQSILNAKRKLQNLLSQRHASVNVTASTHVADCAAGAPAGGMPPPAGPLPGSRSSGGPLGHMPPNIMHNEMNLHAGAKGVAELSPYPAGMPLYHPGLISPSMDYGGLLPSMPRFPARPQIPVATFSAQQGSAVGQFREGTRPEVTPLGKLLDILTFQELDHRRKE